MLRRSAASSTRPCHDVALLPDPRGARARRRSRFASGFEAPEPATVAAAPGAPRPRAEPSTRIEALEDALLTADVGLGATERILDAVRDESRGHARRTRRARDARASCTTCPRRREITTRPHVVLVVGVNGTGKTTTVGKLAHLYQAAGKSVMVCAADTFRAAAVEQLAVWAERAGVDLVRAQSGADPAAVTFDAVSAAKARGRDVVLVDTAGRLHTRANLMAELDKIRRVVGREVPGAPHEVLLVLDATVGQNGLVQAREFMAASGANGIVLTKLDGTAKGGVAVAIAHDLKLPIRYVGVGEGTRRPGAVRRGGVRGRAVHREVVTTPRRSRVDGARALSRRAWPGPHVAQSDRRRRRRRRRWHRRRPGRASWRGRPARRGRRARRVPASARAARTLYCTLEPCSHIGRTGPCVERIRRGRRPACRRRDRRSAIRTVAGRGFAYLRAHGIEVVEGVGVRGRRAPAAPFFTWVTERRPFVIAKVATSRDGFVGRADGRVRLTGPAADRYFHRQRAEIDAIAVGSGTVLADDPQLTARGAYRFRPLTRVIFDWRGRVAGRRARVLDAAMPGRS